ncbi:pyrimidine reductase [Glaciihabitans arcticus]|uniref:Pyrimidine reductase n=1 Tax=Glaciihabitans arcticus TaxID=2668039 RepID=A0A4Q9GQD9_9MICO|nr:dihydrofolate reductase family protein [Glaciihabitans arcticus]TBN56805.1 pyrimidine reductase [Glaciihabitans arcticus]
MILRQLSPAGPDIDLDEESSRASLLDLYRPPRPEWLRLNLITTISGSAAGSDGTSETLTNPADRRLLGVIRELADIVLIGAQSVRAEGFLLPRRTRLAVVTSSGDLSGHRISAPVEPGRLLVLCPASAIERSRETLGVDADFVVVEDDAGRLAPSAILTALRAHDLRSIVCEGGPSLAAQLLAAGLLDEVCLSTSPRLGGPVLSPFGAAELESVDAELSRLLVDDASGLYARWLLPAGHVLHER